MINIWGQWCEQCRDEAPYLAQVARELERTVSFIGIDYVDPRPDLALAFASDAGWTYPQLFDPDGRTTAALELPQGAPQTLFVDASGKVAYRLVSSVSSSAQLRTLIATYLHVG